MEVNWWSKEDDEIVRREWPLGTDTRQIALMLSAKRSKNSIIGRAHRLGLGKHPTAAAKRTPRPVLKPTTLKSVSIEKKPPPVRFEEVFEDKPKFAEPSEDGCRWPVGMNPRVADYFCGQPKREGCPYCDRHAEVAYLSHKEPTGKDFSLKRSIYSYRGR